MKANGEIEPGLAIKLPIYRVSDDDDDHDDDNYDRHNHFLFSFERSSLNVPKSLSHSTSRFPYLQLPLI